MANVTVTDMLNSLEIEYNSQYIAKKTNSQLDDPLANPQTGSGGTYTKYARDLYNAGYYNGDKNGFAWCTTFADWNFYHLCGNNKEEAETIKPQHSLGYGAVVSYAKQAFVNIGRCDNEPQIGDQAFIRVSSGGELGHTGIVIEIGNGYVTTIDGNVSRTIDGVKYPSTVGRWRRSMSWYDSFGHPFYSDSTLYTIDSINQINNCTLNAPKNGSGGSQIRVELIPNLGYKFSSPPTLLKDGSAVTLTQESGGKYSANITLTGNITLIASGATVISTDIIQVAFGDSHPESEDLWVPIKNYLTRVPFYTEGEHTIKIWVRRKEISGPNYTEDPNPYIISQKIYKI